MSKRTSRGRFMNSDYEVFSCTLGFSWPEWGGLAPLGAPLEAFWARKS